MQLSSDEKAALVSNIGLMTLDAICSHTRAESLHAENESLRQALTLERQAHQKLQAQHAGLTTAYNDVVDQLATKRPSRTRK